MPPSLPRRQGSPHGVYLRWVLGWSGVPPNPMRQKAWATRTLAAFFQQVGELTVDWFPMCSPMGNAREMPEPRPLSKEGRLGPEQGQCQAEGSCPLRGAQWNKVLGAGKLLARYMGCVGGSRCSGPCPSSKTQTYPFNPGMNHNPVQCVS